MEPDDVQSLIRQPDMFKRKFKNMPFGVGTLLQQQQQQQQIQPQQQLPQQQQQQQQDDHSCVSEDNVKPGKENANTFVGASSTSYDQMIMQTCLLFF